jgi:hypothetical protein
LRHVKAASELLQELFNPVFKTFRPVLASFRHEHAHECVAAAVHALGDGPAVSRHVQQEDIDAGLVGFEKLFEHGRALFVAKFNHYDGQGRPAAMVVLLSFGSAACYVATLVMKRWDRSGTRRRSSSSPQRSPGAAFLETEALRQAQFGKERCLATS